MRHVIFNSGGFPLTTDSLSNMQESYRDIVKSILGQYHIPSSGNFIVSGVSKSGSVLTNGWIVVDGELYEFTGGSGLYIQLTNNQTNATYEDTASKVTYEWKKANATATAGGNTHVDSFTRIRHNKVIARADCTHLADRVYRYDLPEHVTSIHLDAESDLITNNGFIINRINAPTDIRHGHQLLVRMMPGTGLTFLTKGGEESNILFNRGEVTNAGEPLIRPRFGNSNFIGTPTGLPVSYDGIGYDQNVHVLLQWHAPSSMWKEISRFTIKEGSI